MMPSLPRCQPRSVLVKLLLSVSHGFASDRHVISAQVEKLKDSLEKIADKQIEDAKSLAIRTKGTPVEMALWCWAPCLTQSDALRSVAAPCNVELCSFCVKLDEVLQCAHASNGLESEVAVTSGSVIGHVTPLSTLCRCRLHYTLHKTASLSSKSTYARMKLMLEEMHRLFAPA